jgi:hypothetical protein
MEFAILQGKTLTKVEQIGEDRIRFEQEDSPDLFSTWLLVAATLMLPPDGRS